MNRYEKLYIVGTCTNTKRHKPISNCYLRACKGVTIEEAVQEWMGNIQIPHQHWLLATNMYCGSHWQETLQCVQEASNAGFETSFWILSAGWGLIPAHHKISPYSATFAPSGKDSIHRLPWPDGLTTKERSRQWWDAINDRHTWEGLHHIREFGQKSDRDALFLFILSKDYYLAIEHEILQLISEGCEVVIVSAGLYTEIGSTHPMARDSILPLSDKFKQADQYLNKTNVTLNARLATWLIRKHPVALEEGLSAIYNEMARLGASLPEMDRKDVVRMTDEEVLQFIDKYYEPQVSTATKLLYFLRHKEKKSCEQKRFGGLFRKYQEQNRGGLFDG